MLNRSHCSHCRTTLAWFDLIPVLSWILLRGKCRTCKASISCLYALIELLTAICAIALYWFMPVEYIPAYALLCTALIITIRTDLEEFIIFRYFSLYLIPVALLAAAMRCLPISLSESIVGALVGYLALWIPQFLFKKIRNKDGLGDGDLELLAMIGSFLGPVGVWCTLLIGSVLGSLIGILLILLKKADAQTVLPFGPFLALGALITLFF